MIRSAEEQTQVDFLREIKDKSKSKKLYNLEESELEKLWKCFDVDANGFLEGKEIDVLMEAMLNLVTDNSLDTAKRMLRKLSQEQIQAIVASTNTDVSIQDLEEKMISRMKNYEVGHPQTRALILADARADFFDHCDKDNDGKIGHDEFLENWNSFARDPCYGLDHVTARTDQEEDCCIS